MCTRLSAREPGDAGAPRTTPARVIPKNVVDRAFGPSGGAASGNVHAEWQVDGRLDVDGLARAARHTMRQHPLLDARQGRGDTWILPGGMPVERTHVWPVSDDDALVRARNRLVSLPFDLTREPPVRFAILRGPRRDQAVAVADHALVDGVGIGRTLASLLANLMTGWSGDVDATWEEVHSLEAGRPTQAHIDETMAALFERARPTAVRLAPEPPEPPGPAGFPPTAGVVYHDVSPEAGAVLASRSPARLGTPNDLMVAAFAVAAMQWNRDHGAPALPLSIGVPLNLRPARHWLDGVCNATLLWPVRIDRPDPPGVLDQVVTQLTAVRGGLYSRDVRAFLSYVGRDGPLSVRVRHSLAVTTVVSTVPGAEMLRTEPWASTGDGRVLGGPPAPVSMGATFAVVPDRSTWRLSARYHRSRLSATGATRLLAAADAAIAGFAATALPDGLDP